MLSSLPLEPTRAARLLVAAMRSLGDLPGHEFHGNQWTTLFHGTSVENLAAIRKNGLRIDTGTKNFSETKKGFVYVASDEHEAIYWARNVALVNKNKDEGDVALIEVRIPKGELKKVSIDTNVEDAESRGALRFRGNIKPEWIVSSRVGRMNRYQGFGDIKWRGAAKVDDFITIWVAIIDTDSTRILGDVAGHPFYGNQWTSISSAPPSGAKVPPVYWGSVATAKEEFASRGERVTKAYVPLDMLPATADIRDEKLKPILAHLRRQGQNAELDPPAVRRNGNKLSIIDGNHRVEAWRQKGYTHAPVWMLRSASFLTLGDLPGHPFYGNQWTDGLSWKEDDEEEGRVLNDVPFTRVDYVAPEVGVDRTIAEPPFLVPRGKTASAGIVMLEPDGRIWLYEPEGRYGGYRSSFPKGTVAPGEDLQATAVREVWEETGLVAQIEGHLIDVERTTSMARFYIGRRIAGAPWAHGPEAHAVKLMDARGKAVDVALANVRGKRTSDHTVLEAIRTHPKTPRTLGDVEGHPFRGNQWTSDPSGGSATWLPDKGGTLYHGTEKNPKDTAVYGVIKDTPMFLTPDYEEAHSYAMQVHRPYAKQTDDAHVLKLEARPGKTVDVDDAVLDALMSGDDPEQVAIAAGRKAGADYVTYNHPSGVAGKETEQRVVVALNPKKSLSYTRAWQARSHRSLGDVEGHPFYGNQWTEGRHPEGYEWKPKEGSKSGLWAYHKDGVQVSAGFQKEDAAKAVATINGGKGPDTPAKTSESTDGWPSALVKVGEAKGSNPGGLYKDEAGQKWYVKNYADPKQAAGEQVANDVYHALGIRAPESALGEGGKYASKWQGDAGKPLGVVGLTKENSNAVLDGFAADVFLANWDTVGTGHDNVLVGKDGSVTRIDQGGTLLHRAQGALKPEAGLTKIGEWDSLSGAQNHYYRAVFQKAGVKDGDALGSRAVKQIDRIVAARPSGGWKSFIEKSAPSAGKAYAEKVGAILEARQKGLEKKRDELRARGLGDVEGHPFYGNQWTDGRGPAGYEWKPKEGSKSGLWAYHKDGVQVSAGFPKGDAAKAVATINNGKGPDAPEKAASAGETKSLTPAELSTHSSDTLALLGKGESNAVLSLIDAQPGEREKVIAEIGKGPALARANKEYAETPLVDLRVLTGIKVEDNPVHGQANCSFTRVVTMGSTSVTGDFRHELGHAIHMSMSPELQKHAESLFKEAHVKAAANPAGLQKKLSHDFYETNYGVIGRRGLDNWHENFAEHYRGYHKAVYQTRSGEDPKALSRYGERFPKWQKLWDARYTAAKKGAK